jgi:hypothetical protein
MEATATVAPVSHSQKLARLRRGSATSLAPSISGSTKLPRVAGMPGMMNRKIITAPCRVNILL